MRHIGTLPEQSARTFADYLLTQKIETQLQPEAEGLAVWVCDEDRVPQAREALVEFKRDPADARYQSAGSAADALRRQEGALEQSYRKRQARFQQQMFKTSSMHQPVTLALVAVSVVVAVLSSLGKQESPILQTLHISSYDVVGRSVVWPFLSEIRSGQVWRLVTPIFIHYGFLHLLFNMMMLLSLGGAVETQRGSMRFILLVLVLAVGSNLAEYYLGHPTFQNGQLDFEPSPLFGGMSGVLYGLFGYMWMKSLYAPQFGLSMPRQTAIIMIVWFFLCLFGFLGNIANGAHAGGLLLGLLIGIAPILWHRLRGG